MRGAVENALAQAFSDNGDMVTRWALVAEVIDTDGERGLWTLAPEDATGWDTLGMLTYATQMEQAKAVADYEDE